MLMPMAGLPLPEQKQKRNGFRSEQRGGGLREWEERRERKLKLECK